MTDSTYDKLCTLITQPLALHAAEQLWDATTLFDLTTGILDAIWPEIERMIEGIRLAYADKQEGWEILETLIPDLDPENG